MAFCATVLNVYLAALVAIEPRRSASDSTCQADRSARGRSNAVVAGLPVLLRQLLSLQDAGIEEVEVAGGVRPSCQGSRAGIRVVNSPPVRRPPVRPS
jgi:hypothetical protein